MNKGGNGGRRVAASSSVTSVVLALGSTYVSLVRISTKGGGVFAGMLRPEVPVFVDVADEECSDERSWPACRSSADAVV